MAKALSFDLDGLGRAVTSMGKVAEIPQRIVTKAAGAGANVVRRAVRGEVPVDTGALKKGIVRVGERTKVKGKKVYDVTFDARMNDVFQRPIKNPGEAGGSSDHAYYPASMEYGFLTRSKGGGLSYVPGYRFMGKAAEASSSAAKRAMIDMLNTELDKEWQKNEH